MHDEGCLTRKNWGVKEGEGILKSSQICDILENLSEVDQGWNEIQMRRDDSESFPQIPQLKAEDRVAPLNEINTLIDDPTLDTFAILFTIV